MVTDEEIIFPDVDLDLAGKPVKVSEYRFIDGMKVASLARPLLVDMAYLFSHAADGPESLSLTLINDMFGKYPDLMVELIAISTGEDPDWIASLSDEYGQLLLMTWWRVNSAFFTRRLVTEMVARRQAETLQKNQAAEDAKREELTKQALDLVESPPG